MRRLQIGPERQQRVLFARMMLKECIDPAATEVGVRRRKKGCRMGRGAGGMRDDSASTRGGWGSDDGGSYSS